MKGSLVGSPTISGSIGVVKSARNPSTLFSVPAISLCALGGIDGGFVPWDNLSNLLKLLTRYRRCRKLFS